MPSWRIHEKWGIRLLGFADRGIDKIVDEQLGHDSSRYDVEALNEIVCNIYAKYGAEGLRYFVLHHYLDRLMDILVMAFVHHYEYYAASEADPSKFAEDFLSEVEMMIRRDPKNLLSLFVCDLDTLLHTLRWMYPGKSRRRARKKFEEKLKEAYEAFRCDGGLRKKLSPAVGEVVDAVTRSLPCILLDVLEEELMGEKWGPIHRALQNVLAKASSMELKGLRERSKRLSDAERMSRFIVALTTHLKTKCQYQCA